MGIIELRVKLMREMDTYARENFDENLFYDVWLADGVPDEAGDEMLTEIATIESCWLNIIDAFRRCCEAEGIL